MASTAGTSMRRAARWLLPALALIAAATLIGFLFRGPLALRVMRTAVERNMTQNLIEELPDGLHVALCGAGGPMPDPVRSGPCVAVIAGESLFIVDAGTSGGRNLGAIGLQAGTIDAVLLTHFHSDHIDGLGELALLRWVGGSNTEPLPVHGPTGVSEVVEGFNRAYKKDSGYRVEHHGAETVPPQGTGMVARTFRTPAAEQAAVVWDEGGLRITAFPVEHEPVSPAVGYRFDYRGRSVVISGDTKKSDEVRRNAEDVDLLVHEALADHLVAVANEAAVAAGVENLAKITSDIPDYHTTPVEAAQIAQSSNVGHLLYYHVVPPLPLPGLETVFLEGVSDAYDGEVTVGRDGTLISLPSGSEAIDVIVR